jgi:septum formation topological specificity factor MinE
MTAQSATDIREHLELLETERALAMETTLRDDPAYMADLREEIVATRHAYVGSAVAEIASFRAQLAGPQIG